jgi:hypothetical protein
LTPPAEPGMRGEESPGDAVLPQPNVADGGTPSVPLCIDLDGTLVKSDTLVDSVLVLARQNPHALLSLPGWLIKGKAAFKHRVTQAVTIDVSSLPYNQPLLEYLVQQNAAGRPLFLGTAADRRLAERVAQHCRFFQDVLASDGSHNLAGENKLQAFRQRFGGAFSYIGNSKPDLPILTKCIDPMVANPSSGLTSGLRLAGIVPTKIFRDSVPPLKAWLAAVQPHQWAKNLLVFLPLLLGRIWSWPDPLSPIVAALLAFFSFGLCTSATYMVIDLLELEADRCHPLRRGRPLAAGNLSAISCGGVITCFFVTSVVLAILLPHVVAGFGAALTASYGIVQWLILYAISTIVYSLVLQRIALVNVFVRCVLYIVPFIAGSAATGIGISNSLTRIRHLFVAVAGLLTLR